MQIDPYCQWQKCSPVNVLSSDIRIMQIFAGVRKIWGVKQKSGRLRCRFSYLSLAIFSESSSPRLKSATHSVCVKLLHKHDKLTQCCCAFTLALARLSCLLRLHQNHVGWSPSFVPSFSAFIVDETSVICLSIHWAVSKLHASVVLYRSFSGNLAPESTKQLTDK